MPQCQNRGCQKDFEEESNFEDSCLFHPGQPVFHEGLKGWTCCTKRFTDFTEFLNFPGCTKGKHSTEKPPEPEKTPEQIEAEKEAQTCRKSLEQSGIKMRDSNAKENLPITVTESLNRALRKQEEKIKEAEEQQEVKIDQACTRNGCQIRFQGPETDETTCVYHPGAPVFHEGMKYWSCCSKKKTHDFEEFLVIPGCAEDKHRWFKPLEEQRKAKQCKHEWFQSGTHVVLNVFAKCIDPDSCEVKVNTDSINIKINYEIVNSFELELHLHEKIVPSECSVKLLSTKMDIRLKKAEEENWPSLTA